MFSKINCSVSVRNQWKCGRLVSACKISRAVKKREYAFAYTSLPRLGRRDYSLNTEVDARDKVVRSKED